MQPIARRNLLKLMAGAGAAAACGLSLTPSVEAAEASQPAPTQPVDAPAATSGEAVESQLEPNQYFIVRRRRFYRRRVFFYRPRRRYRRIYFIRRRPRRYFRVVRFYRRRRRW